MADRRILVRRRRVLALPLARGGENWAVFLTDAEPRNRSSTHRGLELERAFAGMRVRITDRHDAFWRVEVVRALRGTRARSPNAG